ncbi:MAG: VOC family protein [Acidimicrobiia bacterium]|nr:VOC family protein [Acidimicrobiia bacterium]
MTAGHPRFHIAIAVDDLAAARRFYGEVLGCLEGRSSAQWIDFDLYGHQLVTHLSPDAAGDLANNPVDGDEVPVPHFGVVLTVEAWEQLVERLQRAGTRFVVEPHVRFEGQPGEQRTTFFRDPAGNALEFKAFADDAMVFSPDGSY